MLINVLFSSYVADISTQIKVVLKENIKNEVNIKYKNIIYDT